MCNFYYYHIHFNTQHIHTWNRTRKHTFHLLFDTNTKEEVILISVRSQCKRWNANTSNNNFTPDTSKQILTINIIWFFFLLLWLLINIKCKRSDTTTRNVTVENEGIWWFYKFFFFILYQRIQSLANNCHSTHIFIGIIFYAMNQR